MHFNSTTCFVDNFSQILQLDTPARGTMYSVMETNERNALKSRQQKT